MPQCGALVKILEDKTVKTVFLKGLLASSGPMFFSALADRHADTIMFVLQDADEAGYFYHDLTQLMGTQQVLFYPSSYRRAVKYGQRDAGSEILRTEVLSRLAQRGGNNGYDEKGNRKIGSIIKVRMRLFIRSYSSIPLILPFFRELKNTKENGE